MSTFLFYFKTKYQFFFCLIFRPNPFRDEIARQIHNVVERRRKDKINQWIKKISELLPYKNTRKESKIGILERAYHYFNQLKDTNDNLMLHNFEKVQGKLYALINY